MSDRYEIRAKLGQGGLGAVYKAYDKQLKREVALKRVLTPTQEAVDNLLHEATALSSLMHPNIVTVFDVGQDAEGGFVVMELLDGETLDDTIARAPLTLPDFAEVVNQTLEALIAAQAVNMTHRDLKPSNVMVIWRPSGRFQIKVLDFGLAKISAAPTPQTTDQEEGIMGSIYFMAPEQFERATLDFRTDMYAMGCIYYYCLTGLYPFDGDTAPQVMMAHLHHQVRPLETVRPDIPKEVAEWVMWLIMRHREDRPATARDALDRFPDLTRPTPVISGPIPRDGTVQASPAPPLTGTGSPATAPAVRVVGTGPVAKTVPPAGSKVPGARKSGVVAQSTGTQKPGAPTGRVKGTAREEEYGAFADRAEAKRRQRIFVIASSLSALTLILIGSFILVGKMRLAKEFARIEVLDRKLEGSAKDVSLLLRHISENPKLNDPRSLRILEKLSGPGVEEAVRKELSSARPGPQRLALLKVVASRSITGVFPTVLEIYRTTTFSSERMMACFALVRIAGPGNEKALLELLKSESMEAYDRMQLENGVSSILFRDADVAGRVQPLLTELQTSSGKYRKSLARILGAVGGGEPVLDRLKTTLIASQADLVVALNNWPDRSCRNPLEKFMTGGDPTLKALATRAYIRLLHLPSPDPDDTAAYRLALDCAERNDLGKVVGAMVGNPAPQTLKFCQETKIPNLQNTLDEAVKRIQKAAGEAVVIQSGKIIPATRATIRGEDDETRFYQDTEMVDWKSPRSWMSWVVKVGAPGTYEVGIVGKCPSNEGSDVKVTFIGEPLKAKTKLTRGENPEVLSLGRVKIDASHQGVRLLYLSGGPVAQPGIMKVKGIVFTKR